MKKQSAKRVRLLKILQGVQGKEEVFTKLYGSKSTLPPVSSHLCNGSSSQVEPTVKFAVDENCTHVFLN